MLEFRSSGRSLSWMASIIRINEFIRSRKQSGEFEIEESTPFDWRGRGWTYKFGGRWLLERTTPIERCLAYLHCTSLKLNRLLQEISLLECFFQFSNLIDKGIPIHRPLGVFFFQEEVKLCIFLFHNLILAFNFGKLTSVIIVLASQLCPVAQKKFVSLSF